MSDTQLLTIALAALPNMLAVLVGILINNARLSDTNTRIADTNTRIAELRVHMDSRCVAHWARGIVQAQVRGVGRGGRERSPLEVSARLDVASSAWPVPTGTSSAGALLPCW